MAALLLAWRMARSARAPAAAPNQQQPRSIQPRTTHEEAACQPDEPFAKSWLAGALVVVLLPLVVVLLLLALRDIEMGLGALLALAPFCCLLLIALFWSVPQLCDAIPAERRIERTGNSADTPRISRHE